MIMKTIILLLGRSSRKTSQGKQNPTMKQQCDCAGIPAIHYVVVQVRGVTRKYFNRH